jgi:sulfur-oxidizing protein SoxZ
MTAAGVLVKVPERAKRGEIVEIKALVSHVMETGYRRTQEGAAIPRDILREFVCTYNGEEVFRAEIHPGIAANPYFAFTAVAGESGRFEFRWSGDRGYAASASAEITVE